MYTHMHTTVYNKAVHVHLTSQNTSQNKPQYKSQYTSPYPACVVLCMSPPHGTLRGQLGQTWEQPPHPVVTYKVDTCMTKAVWYICIQGVWHEGGLVCVVAYASHVHPKVYM